MSWTQRLRIAMRYTFALGRGHLSAFLSTLSMLGLVLAIALLITVLSVMNGFDKEMRERILSLVPHITVYSTDPLSDWSALAERLNAHPNVSLVDPFTEFDALVMHGRDIETVRGIGLFPDQSDSFTILSGYLQPEEAERYRDREDAIILGAGVARRLGVKLGDQLVLISPGASWSGNAASTRFQSVTLSAILETGTELDQAMALVHLPLASRLANIEGRVSGFRIGTTELFDVQRIAWELMDSLPPGYYTSNWMMTHGNLYAAIQLSRSLISILLFSIIAVAAFNVVSSLVLVVMDKQGNIAILRTLGASSGDIAWVFVMQGGMIGFVGVLLGSIAGALGSVAVPGLVASLEKLLQIRFLNTDVYPVSFLPVDLLLRDVVAVGGVAFAMCIVAAIYPARRAAGLAPAQVLSQDH